MPHLTLLRGISGSGKSTYAQALAALGWVVVSRDLLRPLITGKPGKTVLPAQDERLVTKMEHDLIERSLRAGRNVVVDNTNLNPHWAEAYLTTAVRCGATWSVKDFPVDLDVALSWSDIPAGAVRKQFARARFGPLRPRIEAHHLRPYEPPAGGSPAYVFDIDGTLAVIPSGGRNPYDHHLAGGDAPHAPVTHVARVLADHGGLVVFTSRSEEHRELTEAWLKEHGVYYDALYMREAGDDRDDAVVKSEMLDACPYRVLGVFDDRRRVCQMWHTRGVPVFRVGDPLADF